MRFKRLTLLPILMLPQFLACGEGSKSGNVAQKAMKDKQIVSPVIEAGDESEHVEF